MENTNPSMSPDEARAALDGAASTRSRLAGALRLPPYFHPLLGVGIGVHVGLTAWALTSGATSSGRADARTLGLIAVGLVVFLAVAVVDVVGFRRLNGATVDGLVSRVVLGTGWLSSTVYAAGLALAVWAGFADLAWLLVVVAVATGAGYATAGSRWWSAYRADPERHAPAESWRQLAVVLLVALACVVVLVVAGR
jgi:hypothetical protein